jgi:hypothetical protein
LKKENARKGIKKTIVGLFHFVLGCLYAFLGGGASSSQLQEAADALFNLTIVNGREPESHLLLSRNYQLKDPRLSRLEAAVSKAELPPGCGGKGVV